MPGRQAGRKATGPGEAGAGDGLGRKRPNAVTFFGTARQINFESTLQRDMD